MRRLAFILIFWAAAESVLAEIVPAERRITWAPGVPGGIPARTTVFTNFSAGATAAQIQSGLDACPSNQVVLLASGGYPGGGTTLHIPTGVTLRGATNANGFPTTILTNLECDFGTGSSPSSGTSTTLTSGSKDDRTITVGSASGISIGTLIAVVQTNDSTFVTHIGDNGGIGAGVCDWCDGGLDTNKNMGQICVVTNVSGTTLGIDPPLYWSYNKAPTVHPFTASAKFAGVESVRIYGVAAGPDNSVGADGAYACWVKNIESDFANLDHVHLNWSLQCEVRDSYIHDGFTHDSGASSEMSVFLGYKTTACLVENNLIFRAHVGVVLNWGAAGNVVAYNYLTNSYHDPFLAWCINDVDFHGAHSFMNLFESNIGAQHRQDATWGSSSHTTLLRNWYVGWNYYYPPQNARTGTTPAARDEDGNNYAYSFDFLTRSNNLVGNLAGGTNLKNASGSVYLLLSGANAAAEYRFGFTTFDDTFQNSNSWNSTLFHLNYSTENTAIQDGGVADKTIPNSFYLAAKPTFFGTLTWPGLNPTNASTTSVTNIPAGYRFTYGTNPPAASGPDTTPPVISAVSSGTPGPTTSTITWTTDEAATSGVEYGLTASYGGSATNSSAVTSHSVGLTVLAPSTTYHFRVWSSDSSNNTTNSSDATFATAASQATLAVQQARFGQATIR